MREAFEAMIDGLPEPRFIRLRGLGHCRRGHEIRLVSAGASDDGWLVWGDYACHECHRTALHLVEHQPDEAPIGSRRLPTHRA